MQRDRGESVNSDTFGDYNDHGPQRSTGSRTFNRIGSFDELLFPRSFGSIFGSSMFPSEGTLRDPLQVREMKEPVIQELHSDDDEVQIINDTHGKDDKDKAKISTGSNENPHVEHPDDEADEKKNKEVVYAPDRKKAEGTRPQVRGTSFQKVTYGGINGAYYTATTTRRTGNDGVVIEESKQADKTTGQATHRISRGIHHKGHSVLRRLKSDGFVDTTQTLHNLEADELAGFEQAWKGNADRHLPGWERFNFFDPTGFSRGSSSRGSNQLALPIEGFFGRSGGSDGGRTTICPGRRAKKVVRINIE